MFGDEPDLKMELQMKFLQYNVGSIAKTAYFARFSDDRDVFVKLRISANIFGMK